ncbi:short-chain dehydrogenases/reductase [Epithele typhae]|uniref:short-chain dehydrogenases/reductase n=1 Tax=Epithele typhae TaxID=378194 RepID=UPI002007F152|nr:short-chain dehydrogenases/reductase [Epithele typhae]KAH9907670.1 short-chain dehydrogenases/reductase [Epithele typhae]
MSSYVVLGASRGIGLEFVNTLSKNADNKVFAVVRTPESATLLHSLASTRSNVFTVKGDLDFVDSLKAAATEVASHTSGKLDVLILNGARMHAQYSAMTLDKYPDPQTLEEDLVAGFRSNTVGSAHAINAFLPLLRAGTKKQILAISSCLGDIDFVRGIEMATNAAYTASKAALNMVATQFAVALKPEGFTVLSISPGFVNTYTEDPNDFASIPEPVKQLATTFKRVAPDFDENPRTPAVAVSMVLDVLNRSGPEQSGSFLSQYGNKEWV